MFLRFTLKGYEKNVVITLFVRENSSGEGRNGEALTESNPYATEIIRIVFNDVLDYLKQKIMNRAFRKLTESKIERYTFSFSFFLIKKKQKIKNFLNFFRWFLIGFSKLILLENVVFIGFCSFSFFFMKFVSGNHI